MKLIEKAGVPQSFRDFMAQESAEWQPRYRDLNADERTDLLNALLTEQNGLCCYCESTLTSGEHEPDFHIEHFRPQSTYPHLALEYVNLHCSCQRTLKRGAPRHCGNAKGEWFDEKLMLSPLDPDTENRFRYLGDGNIEPADEADDPARITIEKLDLNGSKLQRMRKSYLNAIFPDEFDKAALKKIVDSLMAEKEGGTLDPYPSAVKSIYRTT